MAIRFKLVLGHLCGRIEERHGESFLADLVHTVFRYAITKKLVVSFISMFYFFFFCLAAVVVQVNTANIQYYITERKIVKYS